MTIDQLRYVAEVMKCHSFNKASENLYVSQPAVSVAIRKLESELGEPLFIRNNNGVSPTPFGLELLPFIQNMISLYEQMPIQAYGKSAKKLLRISVANGGFRFFSRAVGQLYMSHKKDGVHLEFHDVTMEQSLSMVTNGTANIGGFAIWSFQKKEMESRLLRTGIHFVPLGSVPPSVSIGPQNPLWNRVEDWVTLDMIQNFPIIYSFKNSICLFACILAYLRVLNHVCSYRRAISSAFLTGSFLYSRILAVQSSKITAALVGPEFASG